MVSGDVHSGFGHHDNIAKPQCSDYRVTVGGDVAACVSLQTLSARDIELHLLDGQELPVGQLKNGSRIRTSVGTLRIRGVADLLDPSTLVSPYDGTCPMAAVCC